MLGSSYWTIVELCKPLFALSFFYCRIVVWLKLSYQLWQDAYTVVTTGSLQKFRPGKTYGINLFLISNVLLSILQIYWLYIIVMMALDDVGKNVE